MRRTFARLFFFFLIITFLPLVVEARAPRGFNQGPYLQIIGGAMNVNFDKNVYRNDSFGHDFEGCYGFNFGWFVYDHLAPEIEMRYSTTKSRGSREHILNLNLNVKYSLITNALTNKDINKLHVMPYIAGGVAVQLSNIPGDPDSTDSVLSIVAPGLSASGGIDFLYFKYAYFGIQVQGDFIHVPDESQIINGTMQKIIAGGWDPQVSFLGKAGVHF